MIPDMPIEMVFVQGISADDLRAFIEADRRQWSHYGGMLIMPPGCEVTIVPLIPERFEPETEDTP
jgi:hypothetical protein